MKYLKIFFCLCFTLVYYHDEVIDGEIHAIAAYSTDSRESGLSEINLRAYRIVLGEMTSSYEDYWGREGIKFENILVKKEGFDKHSNAVIREAVILWEKFINKEKFVINKASNPVAQKYIWDKVWLDELKIQLHQNE